MKAVKLFIKYDKSCMAVINELGYPCRGTLLAWYKEFSRKGDLNHVRMRRYSEEEKRVAVNHFFEHGQCLARTARQLGYPKTKVLLAH